MKTLALGLLFTCSACAQKIQIESDPAVDFARFKTFAIRDGQINSKNPSLSGELIQKRLDADIRKSLEAKGLAFVPSGPSDLNVGHAGGEGPLHGGDAGDRSARCRHPILGMARHRKLEAMVKKSFDKYPPKAK